MVPLYLRRDEASTKAIYLALRPPVLDAWAVFLSPWLGSGSYTIRCSWWLHAIRKTVYTQITPHSILALYIPTTHTPRARMESTLQDPFSHNCVQTHRGCACNGTLLGAATWAPFGQRASRFEKSDIGRVKAPLLIPDTMYAAQRVALSQEEALCITLHRLAYPNRTSDLESFWEALPSYFCRDKWSLWTYWGQLWWSSTRCQPHVAEYRYAGRLLTSKHCSY